MNPHSIHKQFTRLAELHTRRQNTSEFSSGHADTVLAYHTKRRNANVSFCLSPTNSLFQNMDYPVVTAPDTQFT